MSVLFDVLVLLHFVGLAGALGGFLAQVKAPERQITPLMLHGALTQWVTGVAMAALLATSVVEPGEWEEIARKVEVKFLIATLVVVAVVIGKRKVGAAVTPYWLAVGILEVVNIAIAVFW